MPIQAFFRKTATSFRKLISRKEKTTIYDRIIKWCLYLIVFLVPIFFLPLTSDFLELPKALLFYFLVLVAVLAWLTKMVVKKEIVFTRTFLDIPIIIFGLVYVASTIFSIDRYHSLVGAPGYFGETLLTVLFLIFFYFLATNNIRSRKEVLRLVAAFLVSLALIIIFNLFKIFGSNFLPWALFRNAGFDLVAGSPTILAIILAAVSPLIFCLLVASRKRVNQWLLGTIFFLNIFLIFIIGSFFSTLVLIIGLFILVLFLASRSRELKNKWIIIPTLVLAIAVLTIFVPINNLLGLTLPQEINLPAGISGQIIWSAAGGSPLLGAGPENFSYIFSKYKPLEFNQTNLWSLNFNRAANFWFNLLAGAGLLGFLTFLAVCLWFTIKFLKDFFGPYLGKIVDFGWYLGIGLFISWFSFFVSSLFYSFSFATSFLFWLFLSFGAVFLIKEKEPSKTKKGVQGGNAVAFFYSLSFSLCLILGICFIYLAGRYLSADIYFVLAANLAGPLFSNQEKLELKEVTSKINRANDYLAKAIKLNPYESAYHFGLAKIIMGQMQIVSLGSGQEEDLNNLIQAAGNEIAAAINLNKNSTASYFSAISLYQTLGNLIGQDKTSPLILDAYSQLVGLDANNPQIYLERGQIYLNESQLIGNSLANIKDEKNKETIQGQMSQLLTLGEQDLSRAINLKPDLIAGYYNLALVKELKGDKEGAIKLLEKAVSINSFNLDLLYNLGRLYLENNKLDEAINILARAVNLYPQNSNSHWQLSVAYAEKGEKDKAITEMEVVVRLNPENEIAKKKLEELKR
jgi:tetratricopeptide (TPR) repeat protein